MFRTRNAVKWESVQWNPDVAPPSLSTSEILWTEIAHYTIFRFADTLDLPPPAAVTRQRCFGIYSYDYLKVYLFIYFTKILPCCTFRLYIPGVTWKGWGSPGVWQEQLALGSPVYGSMKRLHPAGWNRRGFACSLPLDAALTPLHSDRCNGWGWLLAHIRPLTWSNLVRK